jgi:hypothetical protein
MGKLGRTAVKALIEAVRIGKKVANDSDTRKVVNHLCYGRLRRLLRHPKRQA